MDNAKDFQVFYWLILSILYKENLCLCEQNKGPVVWLRHNLFCLKYLWQTLNRID